MSPVTSGDAAGYTQPVGSSAAGARRLGVELPGKTAVDWAALTAIASVVSTVAFIATAVYVRGELKHMEKDRYLSITSGLFTIWQSREFMDAQLWLLHRLQESTWEEFTEAHRADYGEAAFQRVGSFYDRVGALVRLKLINDEEILATIGADAIAVWKKIEPLVREARRVENASLFDDFERLLPACYECYVPALGGVSISPPATGHVAEAGRMSVAALKRRLQHHQPTTILDVRQRDHVALDPRVLPGAQRIPPGEVATRYQELPRDTEVVVYCACPDDATSAQVATFLQQNGYHARALRGGFNAWRDAGGPMEAIPDPSLIELAASGPGERSRAH